MAEINQELESRIREIEQFTYITTHDLREPLRTFSLYTELLSEECNGKLTPDGEQYIRFLHDASLRLQELIQGLLEYMFLGQERSLDFFDMNELLSIVVSSLASTIEQNFALVNVERLPSLCCNPNEMRMLFHNLIDNAIKFRKEEPPEITIKAEYDSGEWVFSIQDNGIGIEEKNREKIFVIFKRMHNRNEYSGIGIGLAQCRKIVELYGGKIWVESNEKGGSTFKFTIPGESI